MSDATHQALERLWADPETPAFMRRWHVSQIEACIQTLDDPCTTAEELERAANLRDFHQARLDELNAPGN